MNLSMNVKLSQAPGEGLTDFCAMALGGPSADIISADGKALICAVIPDGSYATAGINQLGDVAFMPVYGYQMDQVKRIQKTFLRNTFRTSSEANLIAPNGDTVHFTFEVPADYVFDELAASQPEQE